MAQFSPVLLARVARLSGCAGRFIVDCRDSADPRGYDLRELSGYWPNVGGRYFDPYDADGNRKGGHPLNSPEMALVFCAENRWRDCRLLFSADRLNGDSGYGYDAPSIYRSNARAFRAMFADELVAGADGDADGTALDVRYVTAEMLDVIESLEDYPLLDEDDHSELEVELQQEAWESYICGEWRGAVETALADALAVNGSDADADEVLDSVADIDSRLCELFYACADVSNTYWEEESGSQWIDVARVANALDLGDLIDLTGLPLLPEDQQWRREPYPWQGGESTPLVGALP